MNYQGVLVAAPDDLKNIVAVTAGVVVWSKGGKKNHQVRYGLQVKGFNNDIDAAKEYGLCVRHNAECDNLLD